MAFEEGHVRQHSSTLARPVAIAVIGSRRLEELEAEARYHRERFELYKAKTYGPRPTTDARLRDLERRHQGAESRLRQAREEIAETTRPSQEEP